MKLRIRSAGGSLCELRFDVGGSVRQIKEAVEVQIGIPARMQRLFHGHMELNNDRFRGNTIGLESLRLDEHAREDLELLLVRRSAEQADWLDEVESLCDDEAAEWLKAAPAAAQEDREIVLTLVHKSDEAWPHAAPELRADLDFVSAAVAQNYHVLKHVNAALQADREFMLKAVMHNGWALEYAAPALREDREVVRTAVAQKGRALEDAGPELRADRAFALECVALHGIALEYVAPALRADREVVMTAVKKSGLVLRDAAPELQADLEIVLAAVAQCGGAWEYAHPTLRRDREVMRAAGQEPPSWLDPPQRKRARTKRPEHIPVMFSPPERYWESPPRRWNDPKVVRLLEAYL